MTPTHRILGLLLSLLKGLAVSGLVLLATWHCTYFAMASHPGRAYLLDLVHRDAPRGLQIGSIHWGPHPGDLILGAVDITSGRTQLARINSAEVEMTLSDLLGLAGGEALALNKVRLDVASLHATADDSGVFDIIKLFKPERPPDSKPPKQRKKIHIRSIYLRGDHLAIDTPRGAFDLRDLHVEGTFDLDLLPRLSLSLSTGALHIASRGQPVLGFDGLDIDDLTLTGTQLGLSLRLVRDAQPVVSSRISADLLAQRFDFNFSLDLRPLESDRLSPSLPTGLVISDAALQWADGRLRGAIGALSATSIETRFGSAFDFSISIPRIGFEPGGLFPRVDLDLNDLTAARLELYDHTFSGLFIPRGRFTFDKRVTAHLGPGQAIDWALRGRPLGKTRIDLVADVGLTGGPIQARLETPSGLVDAVCTLKVSLLRKRADFDIALSLENAEATLLLALLPDIESSHLVSKSPFSASAELEFEPSNPPTVSWNEASIRGADGMLSRWDTDTWTTPTAEASGLAREVAP